MVKSRTGQGLFVVVTRTVPEWARDVGHQERYALVVVIEDGALEGQVKHYTQIQLMLRVRVKP